MAKVATNSSTSQRRSSERIWLPLFPTRSFRPAYAQANAYLT